MPNKRINIIVLIFTIVVSACTVSPKITAEPKTIAGETAVVATAAEIQPTDTIPATIPPTATELVHVPMIKSVELRPKTYDDEMTVMQDINFEDAGGDAYLADYTILSSTNEDISVEDGQVKVKPEDQKKGAMFSGKWDCGKQNYDVELSLVLGDAKGNKSEPYKYTIVCGLGGNLVKFPDAFDDNRNGWKVDDTFFFQEGIAVFRNVPQGKSKWRTCTECEVTPENNSVSVEASWSNLVNKSLGILIDDNTCTPDGLVFAISHFGYYTIIQSVRDESGEWSHWRPFIDWTKSTAILKPQNTPNVISAVYEFGDELHVSLFVNGTRVTRVKVFGYNGEKVCKPGLFSSSMIESNFDNFSIPAVDQQ
jgi:hypothetical protein